MSHISSAMSHMMVLFRQDGGERAGRELKDNFGTRYVVSVLSSDSAPMCIGDASANGQAQS